MYSVPVKLKVNDIVYCIDKYNWDATNKCFRKYEVVECYIKNISISCNSREKWNINYNAQFEYGPHTTFNENELGSNIFLTREEAEEKIRSMTSSRQIKIIFNNLNMPTKNNTVYTKDSLSQLVNSKEFIELSKSRAIPIIIYDNAPREIVGTCSLKSFNYPTMEFEGTLNKEIKENLKPVFVTSAELRFIDELILPHNLSGFEILLTMSPTQESHIEYIYRSNIT